MDNKEEISQLLEFSTLIGAAKTMEELGSLIIDKVSRIFKAGKVSLMLLDKESNELYVWASSEMAEELKQVKVQYGQMFAGWVAKEGKPLLVKNVDSEFPDFSKIKLGRYHSGSFIIAPIRGQDKILGVVNITERKNSDIFTDDDVKMLLLVNSSVALQIEKIQLLERIENSSFVDTLTGLFNHRYFQEHLSEEIERIQRYRRHCALIMLDIDNFRQYNENYGYAMGDRVLVQLAGILKENLRKVDIIAHYSAEAFVVILPDTALRQAVTVAEKIREKVEGTVFVEKRTSALAMARLTVSIGVAGYNIKNNKEQFIQQAKDALSEAKQKGKNRVCVFR